jgi:2'-5' RNA ligase
MPFRYKEKKEKDLIEKLKQFSAGQNELFISLNSFGAFEPRTIFIAVQQSTELCAFQKSLAFFVKKELGLFNVNYKDKGYHAHMTVAFRDLKKALFPEAWAEFKDQAFTGSFKADNFWLLKHDGRQWQRHMEFRLLAEK